MQNELRPFWNRIFNFNWKFGLFLILSVCIPRFFLVLNANATQNYSYIGLIMVVSAIVPFIFLSKNGLKKLESPKQHITNGYYWPLFQDFFLAYFFTFLDKSYMVIL